MHHADSRIRKQFQYVSRSDTLSVLLRVAHAPSQPANCSRSISVVLNAPQPSGTSRRLRCPAGGSSSRASISTYATPVGEKLGCARADGYIPALPLVSVRLARFHQRASVAGGYKCAVPSPSLCTTVSGPSPPDQKYGCARCAFTQLTTLPTFQYLPPSYGYSARR